MNNFSFFQHNSCPIHVASQGKPEIVKLLIEADCDVNVLDDVSTKPSPLSPFLDWAFYMVEVQETISKLLRLRCLFWAVLEGAACT